MKRFFGITVFMFFTTSIWSQNVASPFYANTFDEFFMDGIKYICSHSPLASLEEYKSVYPEAPQCEFKLMDPRFLDKYYQADWTVIDSMLYLYNISFPCSFPVDTNVDFGKMLTFLKRKFPNIKVKNDSKFFFNKSIIQAIWFSDTLYIKRHPEGYEYGSESYEKEPFPRFVFRKGKMIKCDTVPGIPENYITKSERFWRTHSVSTDNHEAKTKQKTIPDGFYGNTNDIVDYYMLSSSPLATFKNYRTVFNDIDTCKREIMLPFEDDKNYEALWMIYMDKLYLCDIHFYCEKNKFMNYDLSRFDKIEQLTGVKMQPWTLSSRNSITPRGVMPATWFSGILYMKDRFLSKDGYYGTIRETHPFIRMEFKNGTIVKKEEVSRMSEK